MKIKTPNFNAIAVNAKKAKIWAVLAVVVGPYALIESFVWYNWLERASSHLYKPKNMYDRFFDVQYGWPMSTLCEFCLFFLAMLCWHECRDDSKNVIGKIIKSRFPDADFEDIECAKLMAEYILGLMTASEKQEIENAHEKTDFGNNSSIDAFIAEVNKIVDGALKREYARNPKIKEDLKAIANGQTYVFSSCNYGHSGR